MALTPEDVVNKRFQHVKFREGYDQDEVDDFLDEVVVELRRLYQENDSLRQKLSEAEAKVAEAPKGGAGAAAPAAEDPQATQAFPSLGGASAAQEEEPAPAKEEKKEEESTPASPLVAPAAPSAPAAAPAAAAAPATEEKAADAAAPAEASAAAPGAAPAAVPGAVAGDGDAHGLIALAQKVHDEHVAEGKATRDKLVSEGQTTHDKLVSEGETEAKQIVAAAEKKRDDTLSQLETQKSNLDREIDGLQNFERQYRTRLKSYLSDQLRDLENSGSLAPETLAGGQPGNAKHSL